MLPPVKLIELLEVADGIAAVVVGGALFGGKVITLKLKDVGDEKFILVSTPKLPITRFELLSEFNRV